MLCCVGLIGGMAVGQALGGPWTYIAPAAGFAVGLAGYMKFMKGFHKQEDPPDTRIRAEKGADPVGGMEVDESKAQHQVQPIGKS